MNLLCRTPFNPNIAIVLPGASAPSTTPCVIVQNMWGPALATSLPAAFPTDTTVAFLDLDTSGGSIDVSGWLPTGLADGAIVRLRKIDASTNAIIFNDLEGLNYSFVDATTEFVTLLWDATNNRFHII